MLKLSTFLILAIVQIKSDNDTVCPDPDCVYPGICTPPSTKYSNLLPTGPRDQWLFSGGFCGAVSIQTGLLAKGAWVSQDIIRKQTPYGGGGHGNTTEGYEVLYDNINATITNLKFEFEQWDISQPQPQAPAFLKWMKAHLVASHPLVIFVMEKGNTHNTYNLDQYYDHIEPVFGVWSNHELNDPTVYDDDWFVMGSDYSPDGRLNLGYFRKFNSYPDNFAMTGNCKNAQEGWKKDEMYPCIWENITYGNAILGPIDPKGLAVATSLDVGNYSEPSIRQGEAPIEFSATVTVTGLKSGSSYIIYRYDDFNNVPTNSEYTWSCHDSIHKFTTNGDSYVYKDSKTILSSGSTYYRTVPADSDYLQ